MKLFNKLFNKQNNPTYDIVNVKVTDLEVGFVFDYDFSTWLVDAEYEYDWGNNCFSKEFRITDGIKTMYLGLERDDELELELTEKLKLSIIDLELSQYLFEHQSPPNKLEYNGASYFLEEECPGYYREIAQSSNDYNWTEFVSWTFEDGQGNIICIEQWGEKEFEASSGKYLKIHEISNILPKQNS